VLRAAVKHSEDEKSEQRATIVKLERLLDDKQQDLMEHKRRLAYINSLEHSVHFGEAEGT
jgi:hypothetical protein